MAEKIELEIEITPEGEVRIHTHGLKGAACVAETESLEKALGKVGERTRTAEHYEQAQPVSVANKPKS